MKSLNIHNNPEDAIDLYRKQNPDCKIIEFSGKVQDIVDGLGLEEFPIPIDDSIPKYLVKIGREEHILDLWEKGVVYMNSISYFRNLEVTEDRRGDPNEGAYANAQASKLIIGQQFEIDNPSPLTFSVSNINNGYIYCMIGVDNENELKSVLDANLAVMGGSFVIIHNPEEFIKRCATATRLKNTDLKWGRVQYYDKSKGSYILTPWLKEKYYANQSEFRLYIKHQERSFAVIIIDSIQDIANAYHLQHD